MPGVAVAAATAFGTPLPGLVQAGLVAEYRFDEGSGQVLTDYRGGYDAQLGSAAGADTNDPAWTSQGLTFDGVDDYADVPNAAALNPVQATWLAVAYAVNPSDAITRGLLNKDGSGGISNPPYGIDFAGNGTVRWLTTNAANTAHLIELGAPAAGTWYLLTGTRSPTELRGYMNDELIGSTAADGDIATTTGTLNLGQQKKTFGRYHEGGIAYAMLYNRVLSATEIAQTYRALQRILAPRGIAL